MEHRQVEVIEKGDIFPGRGGEEEPEEAIVVLRKLPAGRFAKMTDVMKALGEIR